MELVVISTNTKHVTLKSPKMSKDDDKQSNYRLMNVLCRKKAISADFANLHNNKRLIPTKISKVLYIFHGSYYITGDERGKKKR